MISTQLVVVGGGPGGYAGAFLAADLGLHVVLVDTEPNPGGVCVYRGCIPSKALLHVAKVVDESRHAKAWGVEFAEPKIDLAKLRDFKDSVVNGLTGGTVQLDKARKIQYLQGFAELVDAHTLRVKLASGGQEQVQFEHALLATGSVPAIPPMLKVDDARVMDSTGALDLPDIPKTLLVVGGGYIGLELGTVYATLGSAVTVVEMTPGLLPGADRDLVDVLAKRVAKTMKSVMLETRVVKMTPDGAGVRVSFEGKANPGEQMYDRVVMAGENVAFAPRAIPAVVFTDPELAWAGLTETQAAKENRDVTIAKFPWAASGRAITLDRTDGLTKLVLDAESERILGVGLVGPGAGELIAEGVLAIEMGATATDLKLSIHPHPTLTETLMESAEVFFGQATHVYRPKRVAQEQ